MAFRGSTVSSRSGGRRARGPAGRWGREAPAANGLGPDRVQLLDQLARAEVGAFTDLELAQQGDEALVLEGGGLPHRAPE